MVIYLDEYENFNLVLENVTNCNTYQKEGNHILMCEIFVGRDPCTPFR